MTPEEREQLKASVSAKQAAKRKAGSQSHAGEEATLDDWLAKRQKRAAIQPAVGEGKNAKKAAPIVPQLPTFSLPDCLRAHANLPPSLMPVTEEQLTAFVLPLSEWG